MEMETRRMSLSLSVSGLHIPAGGIIFSQNASIFLFCLIFFVLKILACTEHSTIEFTG